VCLKKSTAKNLRAALILWAKANDERQAIERSRLDELLDCALGLLEVFVNVFSIQEAYEDNCIILKSNADPIISDSQTKIAPAAFELFKLASQPKNPLFQ
jgi:hypothetical protein